MEQQNTLRKRVIDEGVVVLENTLTPAECEAARDGAWAMLEELTQDFDVPLLRDNPLTWGSFYKLLPMHGMLLQHWRVGHAQWVWDIRQNARVLNAFCQIWDVRRAEDLLVSFDGVSIAPRHETTGRGHYKNNDWFHTDQRYADAGLECARVSSVSACKQRRLVQADARSERVVPGA